MTAETPIRILFIIDYWASPGGTERHLSYLINALDRRRFECSVVVFNYQPNALVEKARSNGIEILHLRVARYYTPNALVQAFKLIGFIRRRRIDIVQTFHYKADIYGAFFAWVAGVRHIVSSKRDAADYKGSFRFFMHKLVRPITSKYIAVSDVVAQVIRDKERVRADKISVIYNGVDLANYSLPQARAREQARSTLGFGADDFVIGMCAWFRPEKDHQLLIDAYMQISETAPAAKLVLVGGGPLLEHYRRWLVDNKLEHRIKLTGPVDDVRPYLAALDVACLVPRSNEGFSNSILEKMATGLPLVVTDVGGNKEAITDGDNGFVIAPADRSALMRHLLALYRDAGLRARAGSSSRARVEQLFSLESMVDRHARLYLSMVREIRGSAP
jgi:glycosyltransferase involved in cell wall biosynthesis